MCGYLHKSQYVIYFKPIHISGPTLNDIIFFIYESNKVYHKRYFRPIQISRPTLNASVCVGLQGENKIIIYTNNQGPLEWAQYIKQYFETKIHGSLFDQVINAFKVNGKHVEICRTTHMKTHKDFIRCTKVPEDSEICFIDDVYHPGMKNDNIYYINIKSNLIKFS